MTLNPDSDGYPPRSLDDYGPAMTMVDLNAHAAAHLVGHTDLGEPLVHARWADERTYEVRIHSLIRPSDGVLVLLRCFAALAAGSDADWPRPEVMRRKVDAQTVNTAWYANGIAAGICSPLPRDLFDRLAKA